MVSRALEFAAMDEPRVVGFDLVDVAGILWNLRWRIGGFSLLALVVALGSTFILPQSFVAKGEVVVRAESSTVPDADHQFYSTVVNASVVATEEDVMRADGLLARISDNVQFPPSLEQPSWISLLINNLVSLFRPEEPVSPEQARALREAGRIAYLKSAIRTVVGKDSSVITVQASTPDPAFSADLINHLLDYYMQDRTAAQNFTARSVGVALQERLRQTNEQIRESEDRVALLLQSPNIIDDTEVPGPQRKIATLGTELSRARHVLAERQAAYVSATSLTAQAHGDPTRLAELLDMGGASTSNLRRLYDEKEADLSRMSKQMKPSLLAPRQAEVDLLRRRLVGEASRIVAQRKADMDAASQVVASMSQQYTASNTQLAGDSANVLLLARERAALANLQHVAGVIQDRLISVAAQPVDPDARILTRAKAPVRASFPNKLLFSASGALLGMVVSSLAIILQSYMRRLRLSALEQAGLMSGPLLASVPKFAIAGPQNVGLLNQSPQNSVEAADVALLSAAIELETVVTRINAKVLTLTSALANEGKSTVAVGLGRKLAGFGWRVLLIHCDLHAGATQYLGEQEQGLNAANASLPGSIIDRHSPLHVLMFPTMASPTNFLHSDRFRGILETARREYDLVLCDTPPVLSVPDALVVARLSDTVLLVSEFNRSGSMDQALELSRRVSATGKSVCGVIVTKMQHGDISYGARLSYTSSASAYAEGA